MQKIRILYLINEFGKGGAQRYLIDVCTELSKHPDIVFKIGVLFDENEYPDLTRNFPIVKLDFKTFSLLDKNTNTLFFDLLNDFKPHIVHSNGYLSEFFTSYYPDSKIGYVCHCHDNMEQIGNFNRFTLLRKRKLLQFVEKQFLIQKKYKKTRTYFLANSRNTEDYFKKNLPQKTSQNVRLFYYGFNFDKFYNKGHRVRKSSSPLKILNVGSFQDKKNQLFLVEIAKELRKRNFDFEMNLIGQGENFKKVELAIIKEGLEKHIYLRGLINNVEDWYKMHDIYLHVAFYEPFGLVFLEAMAAGLPVITLDGKGNRDLIEEGKNGFLFYEQDASKFAEQIIHLGGNNTVYKEMSVYAKEFAKKFDISIHVKRLIGIYKEIISLTNSA